MQIGNAFIIQVWWYGIILVGDLSGPREYAGAGIMTQIQADAILTDKLRILGSPVEIRNSQGVTVGRTFRKRSI